LQLQKFFRLTLGIESFEINVLRAHVYEKVMFILLAVMYNKGFRNKTLQSDRNIQSKRDVCSRTVTCSQTMTYTRIGAYMYSQ
jgi:hypothetical protein